MVENLQTSRSIFLMLCVRVQIYKTIMENSQSDNYLNKFPESCSQFLDHVCRRLAISYVVTLYIIVTKHLPLLTLGACGACAEGLRTYGSRFVCLYMYVRMSVCPILISRTTALLVKIKVLTCNNREYLQNKRVAFHKNL